MTRQIIARTIFAALRQSASKVTDAAASLWARLRGRDSRRSYVPHSRPDFQPERVPVQASPGVTVPVTRALANPPRVPEGVVVYAVGDVHGRADLLRTLLKKITEDARRSDCDPHLVMLGDYIDRGFQSRQVIDMLMGEAVAPFRASFIKGNHEAALLRFLENYEHGPEWAMYGGRETLVSYGVRPPRSMTMNEEWKRAHADFLDAFPHNHLHFLRTLDLHVRVGDYGFVHAGLKPGRALDDQSEHDLLWIRDEFLNASSREDVFVVHGHTPVDNAFHDNRRINVDTGAYFSGRLTAVRLENETLTFLQTR